ncbi:hypothetical protein NDU88_010492 [Pleurodeles waltl]|uniref:Uncharacterized protein n=1 Tax=Pleurodeles waltl TaxID=8319 RepID=A0AAV7PVW8_PLEWA|nr:hypothetical protein NDU88_010492 [Pleurodeles waltl]
MAVSGPQNRHVITAPLQVVSPPAVLLAQDSDGATWPRGRTKPQPHRRSSLLPSRHLDDRTAVGRGIAPGHTGFPVPTPTRSSAHGFSRLQ